MDLTVRIVDDYDTLSRVGADLVADVIRRLPNAVLVPATGNTPMGIYGELGARARHGEIDASGLRVFQLDDYLGIGPDDPRSLYGWMRRALLDPLNIPPQQVVRLAGDSPDPAACAEYDRKLRDAGGVDLLILGLGLNGHLAFNEPPSDRTAPTRIVDLSPVSVASNAAYWGGEDRVPRQAVTAGMTTLLSARRTVLLVSGASKQTILRRVLEGPVSPEVPASFLREASGVTVLADREAAALIGSR